MNNIKRFLLTIVLISCPIFSFSQVYDAQLVVQRTNIEINNDKLIKDEYYEIMIHNREGEKYANITIPYSKLSKIDNIIAYVKDSNGRIVKKLSKDEIVEKSSISDFSFYEDDFVKEFTLRHNSYPYTIIYSYQMQQKEFLYINYWIPVIDQKVPTLVANLKVTVPITYGIAYMNKYINDFSVDTVDKKIYYQWKASYTDLQKAEIYSPPVTDILPSVAIVPQEFNFDKKGSFKDWVSYGNWQNELLIGLNELPENEKSKILRLIHGVEDNKEKIKILYHYLQDETRYINITINTGGMKPFPASYVANNKYGDCKALTNYFKSILDFIQIPSYYTKVYAGNPTKVIDKNFPSQQFNHVILYIPLKDEKIWVDCTSDGAFNYLGIFTQNRDAFVIDHNNSNFIRTPVLKPQDVLQTRRIEIKYDPKNAPVKFQNTYKGDKYENILHIDRKFNKEEKFKIIRNYVVEDGFQLVDYRLYNINRDSVKIELSYEATSQNLYKHYGNDILISNIAFSLPGFEKPEIRKLPVQIDYPVYKIDTLMYQIPVGYKWHKTQDNYSILNEFGEYRFRIYENDENIMVIKSLLINAGNYAVSEYAEFYDFYKQIADIENKTHLSLYK